MPWMRRWRKRIRALFCKGAVEQELAEELAYHLELETEKNVREGMPRAEARRQALITFGGLERFKQQVREERKSWAVEEVLQDLRYGVRQLRRSPAFTAAILVTLAIGIGANTAVFSIIKGVLLRPFPYPDPDRLILVLSQGSDGGTGPLSGPDFLDLRKSTRAFEALAAYESGPVNYSGRRESERLVGARVTGQMFQVFGESAEMGRTLLPRDELASEGPSVVLSHRFWVRSFGGDPAILGRPIILDGEVHTVVGVMPSGFNLPVPWASYDVWTPLKEEELRAQRDWRHLRAVGKLREGVRVETAEAELRGVAETLAELHPTSNQGVSARAIQLPDAYLGDLGGPLLLLSVGAGLVLLIACSNIAGLLLGKSLTRSAEIAMRAALGARRGRLVRQFLSESLLLAVLGGGLGVGIAIVVLSTLRPFLLDSLPRATGIQVDAGVLAFTAAISLGVAILLSLTPAVFGARANPADFLKERRVAGSPSVGSARLRNAFVVAQFAMTLLLANGAGLMFRSFFALREVSLGFEPENVLTFTLAPEGGRYDDPTERLGFFRNSLERIRAIPGVEAAGASSKLPLEGGSNTKVIIAGREAEFVQEQAPLIELSRVMPGYFETMGVPVLQGRAIEARDFEASAPGILINQAMADRLFPSQNPIGQRVSWEIESPVWLTVVGVVGDVRQWGLAQPPQPEMFTPYSVLPRPRLFIAVRAASNPLALLPAIRQAVLEVDGTIPVSDVRPMEEILRSSMADTRFNALLVGLLAAIALVLVSTGIYGVVAYYTAQHTREIGVRMAMGASRRETVEHVVLRGFRPASIGVGIGLIAFLAGTGLLRSFLFGIQPYDPSSLLVSVGLVLLLGVLASLIPAIKASKTNIVKAVSAQ